MIKRIRIWCMWFCLVIASTPGITQEYSIARQWMDHLLDAIRWDSQGPTIHSRDLYHVSLAMYEAYAYYHEGYEQHFLGKRTGDFECPMIEPNHGEDFDRDSASIVAINHAVFQLMLKRFSEYGSKNRGVIDRLYDFADSLEIQQRYIGNEPTSENPISIGQYIGQKIYEFGRQDGSHEEDRFESWRYEPVNPPLRPEVYGIQGLRDPNRWQPIRIREYLKYKKPDAYLPDWYWIVTADPDVFLTPEWGDVQPFALTDPLRASRDGLDYNLYLNPGKPPRLDYHTDSMSSEHYKWGFVLNVLWSAHMDVADSVVWDISPGAIGGRVHWPDSFGDYSEFYNVWQGGSYGQGYAENPKTGTPYAPNPVLRGDYARVIAEYWVDGVFTFSPPGHWIDILGQVSYSPYFKRKWMGGGSELTTLEWDIRAYFAMCGALFDTGIAAWSAKGYYDYIRPISAIRLMASYGQCTDSSLPNYDKRGLPLIPGRIEMVREDDPLAGDNGEYVGKIKVYTWRGPDHIDDPQNEAAGVGWILAGNWWPYQRYTFVTPPFAGYVSGHSAFSTCAAEMLTQITADPFFPGGLWEFTAEKDAFLQFEKGPSKDVTLQWATYHDAANETCLSRIWGGIHPPADDIPARRMGQQAARQALRLVNELW